MKKQKLDSIKGSIRVLEGAVEILLMTLLYCITCYRSYEQVVFPGHFENGQYILYGVYALLLSVLFFNMDGFKCGYQKWVDVLASQAIATIMANFITYWQLCLMASRMVPALPMVLLTLADGVMIFLCTYVFTRIYHTMYVPKNMVMIYGSRKAVGLKFKMETRQDKYHVSKLISVDKGLDYICREIGQYDAVIINDVPSKTRNQILKFCYQNQLLVYVAPKLTDIIIRGAENITLFDTPLLQVRSYSLTAVQRVAKRAMDLAVSLVLLVLTSPLMLLVALAIKIEDGGPVFYSQERLTKGEKPFRMLKFRSMVVNAEENLGPVLATGDDPRITRVGRVIRATRMDELPQLFNILAGDMSMVGPRPERREFVDRFCAHTPEFAARMKVKGGLTGYAQIYGKYNTTPYDKLRLDLMYIENYSLLLDLKLILMTARVILRKESTAGIDELQKLEQLQEETLRRLEAEEEEKVGAL